MKILYISQYYPPEIGAGPVRAQAITNYFKAAGWQVDVVCEFPNYPTGIIPDEYDGKWLNTIEDGNLRTHQVKVSASPRKSRYQQLRLFGSFMISSLWFMLQHPKDYDLIYVSSPPLSGAVSAALFSRVTGIPWAFEVRDLWPDAMLGTDSARPDSLIYRLLKFIEKRLYRSASMVISVTDAAAEYVRRHDPAGPVHVVHNGVDPTVFFPRPATEAEERLPNQDIIKKEKNAFRVGYVGSIGVIHDFEPVVRAAAECSDDPDIEFVIIGDGSQAEKLDLLLKQYEPGNIRWLGIKPYAQIPDYINTFDVGLNPIRNVRSFESIINVKFYEYLACEVPVINLGRGTIRETGDRSGAAITLQPGDYQGLARTIKELKADPEKLNNLKTGSRDFILKSYNRERLSGKLANHIKEFVGKN